MSTPQSETEHTSYLRMVALMFQTLVVVYTSTNMNEMRMYNCIHVQKIENLLQNETQSGSLHFNHFRFLFRKLTKHTIVVVCHPLN